MLNLDLRVPNYISTRTFFYCGRVREQDVICWLKDGAIKDDSEYLLNIPGVEKFNSRLVKGKDLWGVIQENCEDKYLEISGPFVRIDKEEK